MSENGKLKCINGPLKGKRVINLGQRSVFMNELGEPYLTVMTRDTPTPESLFCRLRHEYRPGPIDGELIYVSTKATYIGDFSDHVYEW